MLVILRILFGAAMAWIIFQASENARRDPMNGDLANAGWLALCVILGIANAVVWAPFIGRKVAEAMTGSMTESTYVESHNYLLKWVYWLQARGWKRLTAIFCFLEGIHHPELPTAFIIGMKNAKPGSWLQKVYAKEVWRFDNIQNCLQAYAILKERGVVPKPHKNPQVLLSVQEVERRVRAEPELLKVPKSAPPELQRNPRIQVFTPPGEEKPKES